MKAAVAAHAEHVTVSDPQTRAETWAVLMLALFGVVSIAAMAFLPDRIWGGEERVLLNAPYEVEHFGKVAFPVYGYNNQPSFHRLFVHPPTHYVSVGLLLKAGLGLYYAEALLPFVFAIFCIVFILRADFPPHVRLGWMMGLIGGVGWLASVSNFDVAFELRPDTHMALACLAGLLAAEVGRSRNWDGRWLFVGAFFMVWASTVHYSGLLAWLGIIVYVFLARRALPRRAFLNRLAFIVAGGSLVGIPYVVFHVIRNWEYLRPWFSVAGPAGNPLKDNFLIYQGLARILASWHLPVLIYAFPLNTALAWSIPPFIIGFALLVAHRSTRAVAFASLPVPLFLFFIFHRKLSSYLFLENILLLVGFWIAVAQVWMTIGRRFSGKWRLLPTPALAFLFAVMFSMTTPALKGLTWNLEPRTHELTQIRAMAKEVVGDGELTASIHSYWYFAGGSRWFDLTNEMYAKAPAEDPKAFWSRFDAIAVAGPSPWQSPTGWTEGGLYAKGIVHLRGFENLKVNDASRWVWLSGREHRPVTGFFWKGNEPKKFVESAGGDYTVVSVVFPGRFSEIPAFVQPLGAINYWQVDLPRTSGDGGWVLVMLFDSGTYHGLPQGYTPLELIKGRAQPVDMKALLSNFDEKRDDVPVEESYPELLRHFTKETAPPMELKWESNNPEIKMENHGDTVTWSANIAGWPVLATTEAQALEPGAWYRTNFDFELDQGDVNINVMREGDTESMFRLNREVPQGLTSESFVFKAPPGSAKTHLAVVANHGYTRRRVRFSIKSATFQRVELTR